MHKDSDYKGSKLGRQMEMEKAVEMEKTIEMEQRLGTQKVLSLG
jgi:hypothetical protein